MSLFKLESVQFSEFLLQLHCSIYHECSQWNLIFSPQKNAVPSTSTGFNLSDAWNGGSSLSIGMHSPATADQAPVAYWLPIQSLTITPPKGYQASIVCKVTSSPLEEPMPFLSLCFLHQDPVQSTFFRSYEKWKCVDHRLQCWRR